MLKKEIKKKLEFKDAGNFQKAARHSANAANNGLYDNQAYRLLCAESALNYLNLLQ